MTEELKPCPFDDGDAFIKTIEYVPKTCSTEYYVNCKTCTASKGRFYSEKQAIEAWNERV